jgi:hypothetical protein
VFLRVLRDPHFCINILAWNAGPQRALRRHNDHKEKLLVNFVVLRGLRDPHFCINILDWNAGPQRALRRHNDHKGKLLVNFVVLRGLRDLKCVAVTGP